jgi:hypothetical protein
MPLTGPIPEGRSFFCPRCGALYALTYSRQWKSVDIDDDDNVAKCVHQKLLCHRSGGCIKADLVTLGHDQRRATAFVHAAKPAGIKIGSMQMLVGQIAVFADLHRHAATRARIAVTRNDPGEMTLSLFLAHVLAHNESGAYVP